MLDFDEAIDTGQHEEIEAKYGLPDATAWDSLTSAGQLGELDLGSARISEERDVYIDTPEFTYLRAGFVIRMRHRARGPVMALKGLERSGRGPLHSRFEIEASASDSDALDQSTWPSPLRELAEAMAGRRADLVTLCVLDQRRHRRTVASPGELNPRPIEAPSEVWSDAPHQTDGGMPDPPWPPPVATPLAELSLDRVTILDPADALAPAESFLEVEAELLPGHAASELAPVMAALEALGAEPVFESKLERALAAVAQHPPGAPAGRLGIQPDMDMSEAGRLIWRTQLTAMLLNEAGARRGEDIEYVHDMRVATRRARAAVRIFGPFLKRSALKPYLGGLKTTADKLGAVRDLDVALDDLGRYAASLGPDAELMAPLTAVWQTERIRANARLLNWLDSPPYKKFLARFAEFCQTPGAGAVPARDPGPHQVRHVLPTAILKAFAIMRAYETLLSGPEDVPEDTLHALRIDGKRLRYALEPATELLGDPGRALVKQLKRLQDHLGELNDASVFRDRLDALMEDGFLDAGAEQYRAEQAARVEHLRTSFQAVWLPFVAPDNRDRLARAVARI